MKLKLFLRITFFVFLFLDVLSLTAQDNKYDIARINPELLKNANAVMRSSSVVFEVSDIDNASLDVHYAITILNKSAMEHSYFIQNYNKFIKVRNIQAKVYDENGDPIKYNQIKNDDIKDFSAISGFSLFEDQRVKVIDPEIKSFPFTVEYSFQINYKGLLNYPKWQVYKDYNLSIEKTEFEVVVPEGFKFRYLEKNNPPEVKIIHGDKKMIYHWDLVNLKSVVNEYFSYTLPEKSPVVYLAPNDFKIGGYAGNCETWDNFGQWIASLNEDKDILTEDAQFDIKNLVTGIDDDNKKIEILYNYMQDRTRYVNLSVKMGGWQTIKAETVDRLGYGDCKALSNYMKSILAVVGIKSFYTLVKAGKTAGEVITDFPSNQFNHVILCVPVNNDTIWLECTNQQIPYGYLGSFTENRNALLIDDNGGHLVNTKSYQIDENTQVRSAIVSIFPDGHCNANISTKYSGVLYDNVVQVLRSDATDQKKLIYEKINIPNFEIIDFDYVEKKEIIPCVDENFELKLNNYAVTFGNRLMVDLNLMNKLEWFPDEDENRTCDVVLRRSMIEIDSILFEIPDGCSVEDIPQSKEIESDFGKYKIQIDNDSEGVKYIRYLEVHKDVYPKEQYEDFMNFCNDIVAADKLKFVLMKE